MKLSIIIVNFNTSELLDHCLTSILQTSNSLSYEVFVVDNHSTDRSINVLRERFPWVKTIENDFNRGFSPANNQALKICRGKFILLLNPDTVVLPGCLEKLIDFLDRNPQAWAVGPMIKKIDGSIQSAYTSFPTLTSELLQALFLHKFFSAGDQGIERIRPLETDWISGSCFLLRREVVDEVGLMDEGYFLFNEDVDWSYRIWRKGKKIYYFPKAQILHYGGESSKKDLFKLVVSRHQSKFRFFRKYSSIGDVQTLKVIVLLGLILRILARSVLFLSPGRRQEALDRMKSYFFSAWKILMGDF